MLVCGAALCCPLCSRNVLGLPGATVILRSQAGRPLGTEEEIDTPMHVFDASDSCTGVTSPDSYRKVLHLFAKFTLVGSSSWEIGPH